jgi:outer membrane protein insertion porin family
VVNRVVFVIVFLAVCPGALSAASIDRYKLRWIRSNPEIDSIAIAGNQHFDRSEITGRMYSRTSNFWRKLKNDRRQYIQRETVQRDTLAIKQLYMTNGFLNVRINEEFDAIGEDSAALVKVAIEEGRQFRYGNISFTGNADDRTKFHGNKLAERYTEPGKPINILDVRRVGFDLKTYLANRGFPYAEVNYRIDSSGPDLQIPVTYTIRTDSLVHFGEVTVEGTENFPKHVAARELTFKPGDLYRREDLIESQRRLFESGYFSTVQLRMVQNTPDRYNPDFVLRVRERKPAYVSLRTGAGQSEVRDLIWHFAPGFGVRNFLGSRRLEASAAYSFSLGTDTRLIEHRYRFSYTEPWFIGIRMPLILGLEWEPTLQDPVNDFKKRTWKLSITTRKRFGDKIITQSGFEFQNVRISGVPEDQVAELKELTDNRARRDIFFDFRRDSRDDIFIPRRGVLIDLRSAYYGGFLGGDENFTQVEASWSRYGIVWPGWIMATRVRGSWSEAFGESDEVPLDMVIYLGGANTIRGFPENSVGRYIIGGRPVGPKYTLVFNQEFRWRTLQIFGLIPVLKEFPLWQSIFFDMGNGYRSSRGISFDNMAYSYGTGIQFISPAGPIRIDYARRIPSAVYTFDDRWHFTILYAF